LLVEVGPIYSCLRKRLYTTIVLIYVLQVLLASVNSFEDTMKAFREDPEVDEDEQSSGRHLVTQDEIGQRILTALKKVFGTFAVIYINNDLSVKNDVSHLAGTLQKEYRD